MYKNSIPTICLFILLTLLVQGCSSAIQTRELSKTEPPASPAEISEAFYTWYLDYLGNPASGTSRNPLSDKAYRRSEYLTPSFIEHVDEILASFVGQGGYDPFLCAQDIPQEMKSEGTFLHSEQASVLMHSNFPNHFVTIDLQKNGDNWQIRNITCAFSPEGTAQAFYTWYLAYIGDPASDELRNPLADKAYRDCGLLSAAFTQELDEMTANGLSADPVLKAQSIPHDFSVDPGVEEGTAIVHLQFGSETVHHLRVSMVTESGAWKIHNIEGAK